MSMKTDVQIRGETLTVSRVGGWYSLDNYDGRSKLSQVKYGFFVLTYREDHDQRYAHIPKKERWKYPDEVVKERGFFGIDVVYKRDKTSTEMKAAGGKETGRGFLKLAEMSRSDFLCLSKDIPITKAFDSIH